jgi:hypothetical protein
MQRISYLAYYYYSKALHFQFRRVVIKQTDVLERNAPGASASYSYEIFCEPVLFAFGKRTVLSILYDLDTTREYISIFGTLETHVITIFTKIAPNP